MVSYIPISLSSLLASTYYVPFCKYSLRPLARVENTEAPQWRERNRLLIVEEYKGVEDNCLAELSRREIDKSRKERSLAIIYVGDSIMGV
jgi:hypothetical protein